MYRSLIYVNFPQPRIIILDSHVHPLMYNILGMVGKSLNKSSESFNSPWIFNQVKQLGVFILTFQNLENFGMLQKSRP